MPKAIFTPEMCKFLLENYKGISTDELTNLFNEHFGVAFSAKQIKNYKNRKKLRSGAPKSKPKGYSKLFPAEIFNYIAENYKGVGPTAMAALLEKEFGVTYTITQVSSFYKNHKLNSGVTGRFEKGHPSHNKGKKGVCAPGCEKSWFRKGNIPHTHMEVGTERVTEDGYIEVKIADPNIWKQKHRIVWEEHHGEIPENHVIRFRDGDKSNCDIDNLRLIHRKVSLVINRNGLYGCTGEQQDLAVKFAETKIAIAEAKKAKKERQRAKRKAAKAVLNAGTDLWRSEKDEGIYCAAAGRKDGRGPVDGQGGRKGGPAGFLQRGRF